MEDNSRLAKEPIGKLLLSLAVPTVLAQLVNLLYNIVDRMYVGRIEGIGSLALAGLGVCFPIIMLVSAFAGLVGMGGAPRAAIFMGKQDNKTGEKILGNSVSTLIIFSVILTIIFYFTKEPILMLFGASADTLPYANEYLSIYLVGTIFVQIALGLNMFITSQGFAKMGMATVCIGAIFNIILDPIFIFGLNMGVKGAALATIISQAVSALWVLKFLTGKKTILKIRKQYLKIEKNIIVPVLMLGLSPFIMQATECLVQLVFNKSMGYYGNDMYVALMSILFSVMQFIWLPIQGIAQGAQPILSYNYGAKNYARVRQTIKILFIICLSFSLLLVTTIELFPQLYVGIFTNDPALFEIGIPGIRIFMFGMAIMGAQAACQQTLLSLGQAKVSIFVAFLRKIILLIPLVLVLPLIMNNQTNGILLAEAITDALAAIITTIIFIKHSKTLLYANENQSH